jgi:pyruvate dehydrogenase E2 component (dihydrolipoamide acetyltransferase)
MAIAILMPALSPTMTEGNLARWLKKEGDKVKPGEVIAEIETDKATMEVEAVDAGIIGKILVAEKTEAVKVNALIAVLLESGDDNSKVDEIIKKHAANDSSAAVITTTEQVKVEQETVITIANASNSQERVFASPLAKRVAAIEGVDLSKVKGTGPHERIIKADVLAAKTDVVSQPFTARSGGVSKLSLSLTRKVIAKRLTESKQNIPHFYLSLDCNLTNLFALRSVINKSAQAENKVSINDMIIKLTALAVRNSPAINVSFADDHVVQYDDVDISVAVAVESGLITPIVKNADHKGVLSISQEVKSLVAKAKANSLKPEEFQGGSFTISNLGMYGIKEFKAIINPPQACILAVGAAEDRVVAIDGQMQIAKMMTLSLSCDHRAVDGAVAAEFMAKLKSYIENPGLTLL